MLWKGFEKQSPEEMEIKINMCTRLDIFIRYSRIGVDLLSYDGKPTDEGEHYNRMAEVNWDG